MKTQKQYLKAPEKCPACDSDEITGGPVVVSSGSARQEISCGECGKEWEDVYRLIRYSTI